jgi:hypothetical protein
MTPSNTNKPQSTESQNKTSSQAVSMQKVQMSYFSGPMPSSDEIKNIMKFYLEPQKD